MTKYDFQLNLSTDSSDGRIISKIKPNSTVLEFGCADGRMTKYMSDALGCDVYIVEYDGEAYKNAVRFAKDGICGDAMELEWVSRFGNVRFDNILFADVLEHLTDPESVLKNAAALLKRDGAVYVSIPNITHNDIILKEIRDHFDYTDIGLLDNTHVHFWGRENIVPFVEKCGLHVRSIEATYCPAGLTEQFRSGQYDRNEVILLNRLQERPYGEVYQFILTLTADEPAGGTVDTAAVIPHISSGIYYDAGSGFNQQDYISFSAQMISSGRYNAHYVLSDTSSISRIRFDPVDGQECILQNVSFRQGEKMLSGTFVCGINCGSGILIRSTDPQVIVDIASGEPVIIDADIIIPGAEMLEQLGNIVETISVSNRNISEQISAAQTENSRLSANLQALAHENELLTNRTEELRSISERCSELEGESAQKSVRIDDADKEIARLIDLNNSMKEELELCHNEINDFDKTLSELEIELGNIKSENDELQKNASKAEYQERNHMARIEDLRSELNCYISLCHEKENLLISMERKLNKLSSENTELEGFRDECDRLNHEISLIQNRRLIRYGDKLLKFPKKIAGLFKK